MKISLKKSLLLTVALIILSITASVAQEKKIKKANEEFDRLALIDARDIYLQVVDDGYASAEIFKKLGDTYYWNSDYDNAAKWYGRLVDQFSTQTDAPYYLRAAQSFKSIGKYDESDKLMEKYSEMTGDNLIAKNFADNRNYLSQIAFLSKKYELEKTSISTNTSDFGSAYYLDKIVFASADETTGSKTYEWTDQPYLDLFVADKDSAGRLTNKQRLSDKINTVYHESSAVFTKDGNTIYFTRNNFVKRKPGLDSGRTVRLKLFTASKNENGEWDNVVELPFNKKGYSTAHPALSVDETKLYFSSDIEGTNGMSDLWYVDIKGDNTYGDPVNLGKEINTEARESFPFISKAGNLYFATDGRPGLGGYDIYSTPITADGVIGEIKNIGIPANSNQDDFGIIIDEEKNLGYLSSNRDGEKGSDDDDIYRIQFSSCKVEIAGVVVDKVTGKIIPFAVVKLLDRENNLIEEVTTGQDAKFSFPDRECEDRYTVRASKTGYEPNEEIVDTPNETITLNLSIPLTPPTGGPCDENDLGCYLTLQPIHFDLDKSFIRPDAEIEIAKIKAAMIRFPELKVNIESHTDSRASFKYNEGLSERRAQSTRNWLIANGIEANRLTAKGFGEYRLLNHCSDGVKCSKAEHQENRRSMFLIPNLNKFINNTANEKE